MVKEMTCTGAGGEWWPVYEWDDVQDNARRVLEEFAKDNMEPFGYPSETAHCQYHATQTAECIDCLDECQSEAYEAIERWLDKTVPAVAYELEHEGVSTVDLSGRQRRPGGGEAITLRFRDREED